MLILAPYAIQSKKGEREYIEPEDPFRTPFERDRDRIVHSKALRRLSGKTQVFTVGSGDHFRSRLTHTIEVATTARDISRALNLNEYLSEAIALAHDLGHTPFAHAGQDAMDEMMQKYGDRFEHNEQSLRIVTLLEKKSADYEGLNLTREVREGLMKHRKLHEDGSLVIHSLEAQVADIADSIAYHHHDLDDGLRSGIMKSSDLEDHFSLWPGVTEGLHFSDLGEELFRTIAIDRLMSLLIHDLIEQTQQNIKTMKIKLPLSFPQEVVVFSTKMQKKVEELAELLGKTFYLHEKISTAAHQGKRIIKILFEEYSKNENLLPLPIRKRLQTEKRHIIIKDYIAGMTDEFARNKVQELGHQVV